MMIRIKSRYILQIIFTHLKNRKKLNLFKHNKNHLSYFNITKEDFNIYNKIKEFNEKYKVDIEDVDIEELVLIQKNLGNKGLEDLIQIELKQLKILYLHNDDDEDSEKIDKTKYVLISDISALENAKFENLKELDLSVNKITDINVLEKVNFKELKELYLSFNKITDINVLEKYILKN